MPGQNLELENYFEDLAKKWPSSFVSRDKIEVFSGGAISIGRMANLDCMGEGPQRFRIGRKVVYPLKPLIEWFLARSEPIQPKPSTMSVDNKNSILEAVLERPGKVRIHCPNCKKGYKEP